jgi:hypothetical protein
MYIYIHHPGAWSRFSLASEILKKLGTGDLGPRCLARSIGTILAGKVGVRPTCCNSSVSFKKCSLVRHIQSKCATGWLLRCVMIMWDSNAGDLGHIQSRVKTRHLTVCLPGIPTSGAFSKTCWSRNLTAWRDSHQHSSSACTPAHSHQPGQHCPI